MTQKRIRLAEEFVGPGTQPPRHTRWQRIKWRVWRLRRQAPYWRCYIFGHDARTLTEGGYTTRSCRRCHFREVTYGETKTD